jgi:hypothetical protein
MSEFTNQLRQPSGYASLDEERRRAADELDRLQAIVDHDTETQPCGHATHWTAYRNPVDAGSALYCVFCEMERLQAEARVLWKCVRNEATEQQAIEAVKRGDYLTSEELLAELKARQP